MKILNLPTTDLRVKEVNGKQQVFDALRKKYVRLTPEEWVRQHFINYAITHLKFPAGLIAVEMPVNINGLNQRADIVMHSTQGQPIMVVECKAPEVSINKTVFEQASRYNLVLRAQFLVVTNGLQHFCARINNDGSYEMMKKIPQYDTL